MANMLRNNLEDPPLNDNRITYKRFENGLDNQYKGVEVKPSIAPAVFFDAVEKSHSCSDVGFILHSAKLFNFIGSAIIIRSFKDEISGY